METDSITSPQILHWIAFLRIDIISPPTEQYQCYRNNMEAKVVTASAAHWEIVVYWRWFTGDLGYMRFHDFRHTFATINYSIIGFQQYIMYFVTLLQICGTITGRQHQTWREYPANQQAVVPCTLVSDQLVLHNTLLLLSRRYWSGYHSPHQGILQYE